MTRNNCLFCSRQAIIKNEQGFYVCNIHKKEILQDINCVCNEILSIKNGRYGTFFLCSNYGPISLKKALSINQIEPKQKSQQKEITIRSDEVDFI
ncbi:hypothetical protein CMO90_02705 [Candidatus Woesearchaeota archaeon]|jgi:hypothetical protein|nr:hypothetical protein [Candidatus Woesearchaeota archaeon]|tara:strand:+ start:1717 stop:2001 length:285 start_codon:yes stop_codon:yes gene_type:complete